MYDGIFEKDGKFTAKVQIQDEILNSGPFRTIEEAIGSYITTHKTMNNNDKKARDILMWIWQPQIEGRWESRENLEL